MDYEIKHILVPTDGSESALQAARLAGTVGRWAGARVSIVMVHPDDSVPALAWNSPLSVDEVRAKVEREAEAGELARTCAAVGELASKPQLVQLWGHPIEQICQYCDNAAVDLVVVGSHGRSGLKRMLLGSVSSGVVQHARCPVTVVR